MIEILAGALGVVCLLLFYSLYLHSKKSLKIALLQAREAQLENELTNGANRTAELREELKGSFATVAAEALKNSNEQLFQFAEVKMSQQQREAQLELENKQNQMQKFI